MSDSRYDDTPISYFEEDMRAIIDGTQFPSRPPKSKMEELLKELNDTIKEGGGGGGTTNYNQLSNKPEINGVTLSGNKTSSDLSIPTASDLAGKQDILPVTASGNDVAFNGDIQDGQGNTLSVLAEALTKTASGNPVVITDCAGGKARSLVTSIEPIQDLHGYDKPWVGGAYKNKYKMRTTSAAVNGITVTPNSDQTVQLSGTATGGSASIPLCDNLSEISTLFGNGGTFTMSLKEGTYGGTLNISIAYVETQGGTTKYLLPNTPTEIPAGSIAMSSNLYVASGTTVQSLSHFAIQLESGSTATTFAPYSNICPISGGDSVVVNVDGTNKFDKTTVIDKTYINLANGALVTESYTGWVTSQPIAITGSSIKFSGNNNASANTVRYRTLNSSGTVLRYGGFPANTESGSLTVETGEVGIQFCIRTDSIDTFSVITESTNVTIQLGQTVYGADINWDTGVATVTDAIFDLGNNNYTYNGGVGQFYTGELIDGAENIVGGRDGKCSIYKIEHPTDTASLSDGAITFLNRSYGVGKTIWIKDSRFTNPADLKTALSGQTLVYPLATPTTIQLTPTEVQMLKGYNRVTIESGSIEIEYIAKAISGNDEEIAPLVGDKATKSYAVNDFIERADGLYRVTASIASGASFTANNTVKMSIGEALTYLYNK